MPRSKTRALARAARRAEWERTGVDDSGRTAARVDYVRREIRRRLRWLEAVKAAAHGSEAPRKADSPDDAGPT
jgi:hypothetical protein